MTYHQSKAMKKAVNSTIWFLLTPVRKLVGWNYKRTRARNNAIREANGGTLPEVVKPLGKFPARKLQKAINYMLDDISDCKWNIVLFSTVTMGESYSSGTTIESIESLFGGWRSPKYYKMIYAFNSIDKRHAQAASDLILKTIESRFQEITFIEARENFTNQVCGCLLTDMAEAYSMGGRFWILNATGRHWKAFKEAE